MDKVDSLQKGYRISIGINSAKQKGLKEQLTQMKENDKAKTLSEMIAVLADKGYEIKTANVRPSVFLMTNYLSLCKIKYDMKIWIMRAG